MVFMLMKPAFACLLLSSLVLDNVKFICLQIPNILNFVCMCTYISALKTTYTFCSASYFNLQIDIDNL